MKILLQKKWLGGYFSGNKKKHPSIEIEAQRVPQLRFYQFKKSTAAFFFEKFAKTEISVADTPHFQLASALQTNDARMVRDGEDFYRDYLRASWGEQSNRKFDQRISDFKRHFAAFKQGAQMPPAIVTALLNSEENFVVDGNHRAAFAAALGRPLSAEIWGPEDTFLTFSKVKEFYGTDHRNMPYQSIFLKGQEVVAGRRDDAIERLSLIPKDVIVNRNILDVASNVGMSSLLARSMGASACFGLEISLPMVNLSTRFAMFNNAYPSVNFQNFNADQDNLEPDTYFDTAFMFSIYNHLKSPENLIKIADKNISKYIVFEGHPGTQMEDYLPFFESGIFRKVEELGRLQESAFNKKRNRILWLCEK